MTYWEKTLTRDEEYWFECPCSTCIERRKNEGLNDFDFRIFRRGISVNLNSNVLDKGISI